MQVSRPHTAAFTWFVWAGILGFYAAPAHAQFRYAWQGEVREIYSSNVFAGLDDQGQSDFITEIEPGFRLYHRRPRNLFMLGYDFLFQLYAQTHDPSTGEKLWGYGNAVTLSNATFLSHRTTLTLTDHFGQGTENVVLQSGLTAQGTLTPTIFTTGYSFINNHASLDVHHFLSEEWSLQPGIASGIHHIYSRTQSPQVIPAPSTWTITPSHILGYHLRRDIFDWTASFTFLNESAEGVYPVPLQTYLLENSLGWEHRFKENIESLLRVGLDFQAREIYEMIPSVQTGYSHEVGPMANAALRYHYHRRFRISLDYLHRTQVMMELLGATTTQMDQIGVSSGISLGPIGIASNATYRYLRANTRDATDPREEAFHLVTLDTGASYNFRWGLTVDLSYQLELVRNRFLQTSDPTAEPPSDFERHLVMLSIGFAWPPPSPEDRQLHRSERSHTPLFETEERTTQSPPIPSRSRQNNESSSEAAEEGTSEVVAD